MNDEELDNRVESIRVKYNTKKVMCVRVWKE